MATQIIHLKGHDLESLATQHHGREGKWIIILHSTAAERGGSEGRRPYSNKGAKARKKKKKKELIISNLAWMEQERPDRELSRGLNSELKSCLEKFWLSVKKDVTWSLAASVVHSSFCHML